MCDSKIAYRMDLLNTQLAFRKSRLAARTFTIKCKDLSAHVRCVSTRLSNLFNFQPIPIYPWANNAAQLNSP